MRARLTIGVAMALALGLSAGAEGAFMFSRIADTSGPFSAFGTGSAINGGGTVAFLAGLDAEGDGIFTGPDPVANRVIRTGDFLDGSTVLGLGFSHFGLNDAGSLTFKALLADGRSGIYRADAVGVPEPPTMVLLGAVVALLGLVRFRRRKRRDGSG